MLTIRNIHALRHILTADRVAGWQGDRWFRRMSNSRLSMFIFIYLFMSKLLSCTCERPLIGWSLFIHPNQPNLNITLLDPWPLTPTALCARRVSSTSAARARLAEPSSTYQNTSPNLSFSACIHSMSHANPVLSHLKQTIHSQSDMSAHLLHLFDCLPLLRLLLPFCLADLPDNPGAVTIPGSDIFGAPNMRQA